jgi:hypothetical protein
VSVYAVELLYQHVPDFDSGRWLAHLQAQDREVEEVGAGRKPGTFVVAYPTLTWTGQYGRPQTPLTLFALSAEPLPYEQLRPALQQTWDWPEAKATVAAHQAVVRVADFHADGLDARTRLSLIHTGVSALLASTSCQAIHWQASQHLVLPDRYLAARQQGDDPIFPAIHVRHFAIHDPLADEHVSDTLGLATFNLPDVQCHYSGLERTEVANILRRVAYVLFAQGDVLADGDRIAAIAVEHPWRCRRGLSLTPPVRDVIDLDPGPLHAAGKRRENEG